MIYQLSIPRFFLHEGDDFSWRFRVNCPSPGQVPGRAGEHIARLPAVPLCLH